MSMTSHRPYMVRALYEWILDNNCTPYILVNAHETGVEVPQNFVKDGQIVLNISPVAVQGLLVANEGLEFHGRFGGIPMRVFVPIVAIMGIYAKENGQGMIFELGGDHPRPLPPAGAATDADSGQSGGSKKEKPASSRPSLRVVK
jgi:stringent starvation protein B